jgi:peptidoglycan/LPS O-acetylase OafA/YrhL
MTLAVAGRQEITAEVGSYRLFGSYRAALALAVVVSHSQPMLGPNFVGSIELGNIAVMSFFVLSGFIISEAGSTFYRGRPLAFLANRFWRIAPIYWLALAISIAVHFFLTRAGLLTFPDAYATPPHDLFSVRTITANVFGIFPFLSRTGLTGDVGYGFVRFAWAVMVEVIFYLAAFGCFCAATLLPGLRTIVYGGAVAGALALHVVNDYWRPVFDALTFAPYFALGVCLYGMLSGSPLAIAGASLSFAEVILHYLRYAQGRIRLAEAFNAATLPVVVSLCVMALMPALIIVLSRMRAGHEAIAVDRRLGELSYPMYVTHYTVLVVMVSLTVGQGWRDFIVTLIASVCLAWLVALAVETPLRSIRNQIRGVSLG